MCYAGRREEEIQSRLKREKRRDLEEMVRSDGVKEVRSVGPRRKRSGKEGQVNKEVRESGT